MKAQRRRRVEPFVREAGSSALPTSTTGPTAATAFFNIAGCVGLICGIIAVAALFATTTFHHQTWSSQGANAKVEKRTEDPAEKDQLEEQKQQLAQQQRAFREAEAWRQQLVNRRSYSNIIEVRNLYQAMETLQLVDLLGILMTNGSASSLPWMNITPELLLDSVWTITRDTGAPSRSLRRHPVAVGAQKVVLPMPDELPILFTEYVVWIQHSISELKQKNRAPTRSIDIHDDHIDGIRRALDLACDAHTRFVHIHPFADGIGRMARLLDALVLQRVGLPPPMFSRHHRQEYMNAVSAATIHGNYEPLCQMHLAAVVASLDAVEQLVAEGDPFASCNHSRQLFVN